MEPLYNIDALYKKLTSLVSDKPAVIVCIGTDLVGGDCLGPLVGQFLTELNVPAFVYGTLQSPVSALNVDEVNRFIRLRHPGHTVIAIDASVGKPSEEGKIRLSRGPLLPGAADGKKLLSIGDVSLTAVTSSANVGEKEFALVRLGFVYALAKQIAGFVNNCLTHSLYYTKNTFFAIAKGAN